MLSILFTCDLPEGSIHTTWIESTRRIVPEVEAAIEQSWQAKLKQPNIKLWDGPMCRLEKWELRDNRLHLELSPTSYRIFFGTNMSNPHLLKEYGREVGANPIGVSPALETADGYLMLGRRNSTVAYHPNLLHPFAGALEPEEADDVFKTVRRELREELHFTPDDIAEIRMLGMVEDAGLRQPEPIFYVRSTRSKVEIEQLVQQEEHHGSWSVKADVHDLAEAVRDVSQFTPVGVASLLLWGLRQFGEKWSEDLSLAQNPLRATKWIENMKKYTVSDGKLVLHLEEAGGGWYTVTSPIEPGLVTEARTIKEAFEMAYDAQALLIESRRDLDRWNRTAKSKRKKTG